MGRTGDQWSVVVVLHHYAGFPVDGHATCRIAAQVLRRVLLFGHMPNEREGRPATTGADGRWRP